MTSSPTTEPFADVFRRVGPSLHRLALAITCEPAAAEDLVQEACVRVWRRRGRLLQPGQVDRYLLRTVRNLAYDRLRRAKVREKALEARIGLVTAAEDAPVDAEAIERALASLPTEQREVVVLRVYEGLSFKEVALRTETPLGTVHSRYRYALDRLRPRLEGEAS